MMTLIYDQDERLLSWASERIGGLQFRPDAKVIGHMVGDRLTGVVVYDGFSQCDCNIHIASDGSRRWLSRGFLAAAFAYPFVQCGFRRVTGLVPAKNKDALKFDLHLGFTVEGHCRNALPDDDIIVLGMLREDCPYITKEQRHA